MEPRENHGLDVGVPAARCRSPALLGVLVLHVQESVDQVQPRVALPDLLPEVRGPVTARRRSRRVTRATGPAGSARPGVEWQEPRLGPGQPGSDERQVRIDCEVDYGTAGENQLLRISGCPVLTLRVL